GPPQAPKKRRRGLIALLILVVVLAVGSGAYALFGRDEKQTVISSNTSSPPAAPQPSAIEGKYLISGTMVFDRVVASEAGSDLTQPFKYFDTLGDYDTMIADLECPVTDSSYHSVKGQEQPRFNCSPDWIPQMKKYFGVIKLAGNHTYDMGAAGFTETVNRLQKGGIQTVGHFNPHAEKDNCRVVGLPVRVQESDGKEEKSTLPVAICAFNYKIIWAPEPGEIEAIQKYAKIMPVFGLLQSGAEYVWSAPPEKIKYAHEMIDNGADFVIGNGAHGVQNSDVYKDKLVVYSLGNFIFDQTEYETMRSVSIAVDISAKYDENLAKWLALSAKCNVTAREDSCLAEAEQQGLSKINFNLKYDVIGSSGGVRKITKRADATLQKSIEERLNWAQTIKELGQ
ncbi:MAG TPA: CapA family protein, partial [Candidatus Saccharimonadales bacterium]|nr:CapA family protein [Candidatus Saccharimonadales bacterium]